MELTRQELRSYYRQLRKQLSLQQQQAAAQALAKHFSQHELFLQSQHIAFYYANDGEIDPCPLLEHAWLQSKHCYLPKLTSNKLLGFALYTPNTKLEKNRYKIAEPMATSEQLVQAQKLDLILVPLVAFDEQGNRLGMGGGYYDKTLAFLRAEDSQRPYCVGLAYTCQKAAYILPQPWDVPLNGIATENNFIPASRS